MRNPLNYGSKEAALVIGRILDRLANGPADTKQLIAATHRTGPRARGYIRHLDEAGRIYCLVEQAQISGGGTTAAVWALVQDFAEAPAVDDTIAGMDKVDKFARRVIVRQEWTPNHVRMPMECLLFGVPKVLQGSAAC